MINSSTQEDDKPASQRGNICGVRGMVSQAFTTIQSLKAHMPAKRSRLEVHRLHSTLMCRFVSPTQS